MKRILVSFLLAILLINVGCSSSASDSVQSKEQPDIGESTLEEKASETKNTDEATTSSTIDQLTNDLFVHYIDAGQADAILFQYVYNHEPYNVLFDAGDWNKTDVVSYLHDRQIKTIDLIIISHPHADHIGQLPQIMDEFTVDEVWFSGNTTASRTFQQAAEAVLESDADYYEPRAGETFDIGSLGIEIIHPSTLTGKLNEDSISARFTYGDIALVFTGDAYKNEEREMIKRTADVSAQILHLGHHGSNTSTDEQFIEAIQPEIAIYSAGDGNSYGHPHIETLQTIENAGIELYGTDVHGTIIVTTDGETYSVETEATGTIQQPGGTNGNEKPKESTVTSCIDINTASLEELKQIVHIGEKRAQQLIDLRPFDTLEDLTVIDGLGPARMTDIIEEEIACIGGN